LPGIFAILKEKKNTMKKMLGMGILIALITSSCGTQKEKIKGDRDVISVNGSLQTGINTISVDDAIEVELVQARSNDYILTTDRNLVSVVDFKVVDSVLTISTNMEVTSAKELSVYLKLQNPQHIILKNDSKLETPGQLEVPDFSVTAGASSRIDANLTATNARINLRENASGQLNIKSEKLALKMSDRTDVKGKINTQIAEFTMSGSSEFNPRGKTNELNLALTGKADYKGDDFDVENAAVTLSDRSAAAVSADESLSVYAQDKAVINVYGKPNINVKALNDDAQINKK